MTRTRSPHSTLTVVLALALGAVGTQALTSEPAGAYPAGPVVSLGSNPIESMIGVLTVNVTGRTTDTDTAVMTTANTDFIITDVVLTTWENSGGGSCQSQILVKLSDEDGDLAQFVVVPTTLSASYLNPTPQVVVQLNSGVRLRDGKSLSVSATEESSGSGMSCTYAYVAYTLSGYHAQP